MNFSVALFSDAWHWAAGLLSALVLGWCVRTGPWRRLREVTQINVWAGFAVVMVLLWSMQAGVKPGLNLHLIGAMAAALVFGPQLAIGALGLTLLGITLNGSIEWGAVPLNFLLMAVFPVLVAHAYHCLLSPRLPRNFFVYIFIEAFLGAGLVVLCQGLFASLLLVAGGAYDFDTVSGEYLPYFLLLGFSEAWLSGMVVTLMVVFRPEWVSTFDDLTYLRNK